MKKVTIMITCRDRQWTLPRVLNYYKNVDNIFVLDSSMVKFDQKESFPWAQFVEYSHSDISIYDMWIDFIENYVKTDYICWNNDDDFTVKDFLHRAADFLDENKNFSMALGQHIQIGNPRYGQQHFLRPDIVTDDPSARLDYYFDPLFASPHGVIRKETFLNACKIVSKTTKNKEHSLGPIRFWDKILNFIAACDGNIKTIDCLGTVRSYGYSSPYGVAATGRMIDDFDYPNILEKDVEYSMIIERISKFNPLAEYLSSIHGMDIENCKELTKRVFKKSLMSKDLISYEDLEKLPINRLDGKEAIEEILNCIKTWR